MTKGGGVAVIDPVVKYGEGRRGGKVQGNDRETEDGVVQEGKRRFIGELRGEGRRWRSAATGLGGREGERRKRDVG